MLGLGSVATTYHEILIKMLWVVIRSLSCAENQTGCNRTRDKAFIHVPSHSRRYRTTSHLHGHYLLTTDVIVDSWFDVNAFDSTCTVPDANRRFKRGTHAHAPLPLPLPRALSQTLMRLNGCMPLCLYEFGGRHLDSANCTRAGGAPSENHHDLIPKSLGVQDFRCLPPYEGCI